ncbi:MAG: thiamine-binding protein [Chloroflexi bacterium]|nr:thiamine-binding protein [Chloroflexota bacterium]
MDPNRTVNIGIQVLPLTEEALPIIERAIATLQANAQLNSDLTVEVGPLETTIEGPFEAAFDAAKAAHLACIEAGADHVVTFIKIADGAGGSMTIEEKTARYRE